MSLFVANRGWPMFALDYMLLLVCLAGMGCAKTTVEMTRQYRGALPRPERILVHPFATSPEEVRLDWSPTVFGAWKLRGISEGAEKRDVAEAVAKALAQRLVTKIRALGMPAELVEGSVPPISGPTLAISGQFLSINEGSRTKRVLIGLGAGHSDVRTAVEVIELFPEGRRVVDQFEIDARSGRKPGAAETMGAGGAAGHLAVSAAVAAGGSAASETFGADVEADAERTAAKIASVLQAFFVRQGWIAPEGR